ncbi:helix-turn-helix domain-containing protein [Pedobacter terrae]|uniref:helix-turn-helix domain-containing protein n=1 Tax=Pedobacter terrae TaxID=405671 RepID=UPI002FF78594
MENVLSQKAKIVAMNIRLVREYRGYTQGYLAAKLSISQNAYSKIELGYSRLTIDRLFQLEVILRVEVVQLVMLNHRDLIKTIAQAEKQM